MRAECWATWAPAACRCAALIAGAPQLWARPCNGVHLRQRRMSSALPGNPAAQRSADVRGSLRLACWPQLQGMLVLQDAQLRQLPNYQGDAGGFAADDFAAAAAGGSGRGGL